MKKQKSKGKKNTEQSVPKSVGKPPSVKEEGELSADELEQVSGGVDACKEYHIKYAPLTTR